MNIKKLNNSAQLSEWAQMVSQCRNSGMTVSAWCAEHGINIKTYYYRLKRVCEAIPEAKPDNLPMPPKEEELVFAEVTPADRYANKETAITVRFGSVEMEIHNGAEPGAIEAALKALSRIC